MGLSIITTRGKDIHGESKMGFYHCHGGGRLLVDLLNAHVQGRTKMEP